MTALFNETASLPGHRLGAGTRRKTPEIAALAATLFPALPPVADDDAIEG